MTLDRREFLKRAALVVGGGLSVSCVSAVEDWTPGEAMAPRASVLVGEERALLEAVVDRILPRTHTPGALDAGVPDFIEFVLERGYGADELASYREGLAAVADRARASHGETFVSLDGASQDALLTGIELAEFAAAAGGAPNLFGGLDAGKPFFGATKELTLVGYYTSKVGIGAERTFSHWPGHFDGAVNWQPGQKPWHGSL